MPAQTKRAELRGPGWSSTDEADEAAMSAEQREQPDVHSEPPPTTTVAADPSQSDAHRPRADAPRARAADSHAAEQPADARLPDRSQDGPVLPPAGELR